MHIGLLVLLDHNEPEKKFPKTIKSNMADSSHLENLKSYNVSKQFN